MSALGVPLRRRNKIHAMRMFGAGSLTPLCTGHTRHNGQGNRISKLSDKLGQVFVIPACELELSTQGRLGVVLSHDIESHVAQDGEIVGSIVEAISGLILVHND